MEKITEIKKEPRVGSGHPNLDPALKDPISPNRTEKKIKNKK
jgi:hypothetical protein